DPALAACGLGYLRPSHALGEKGNTAGVSGPRQGGVMRPEAIRNQMPDWQLLWLSGGGLRVLVLASLAGAILARTVRDEAARDTIANLNLRIRSWWVMCAIFSVATLTRGFGTMVFFALVSFLALREFLALTPARPSDHSGLVVSFFIALPLQYCLLRLGQY